MPQQTGVLNLSNLNNIQAPPGGYPTVSNVGDQEIRNFINSGNYTPEQISSEAAKHGISDQRISQVMGNTGEYSLGNIERWRGEKANQAQAAQQQAAETQDLTNKTTATFTPAPFVPAVQDPIKGTVAGQVNSVLDRQNSPLMQTARTFADKQTNRRGLLNSSLNTEAGYKAMTDQALNIAVPDAAANNQFAQFNAGNQNSVNTFNAGTAAQVSTSNSGVAAGILNNRESLATSTLNNRDSIAANERIAQLDVDTKLAIADLQALSKDSELAAGLLDGLNKRIQENNLNDDLDDETRARLNYEDTMRAYGQIGNEGVLKSINLAVPDGSLVIGGGGSDNINGLYSGSTTSNAGFGGEPGGRGASKVNGQKLGPVLGNENYFNGINLTIGQNEADYIQQTFNMDPKYLFEVPPPNLGFEGQNVPLSGQEFRAQVKEALEAGKIQPLQVRDKDGNLVYKELSAFSYRDIYHDPQNVLGLR